MKILLITPNFFNYPKIISDELTEMGYEVDWFDDRPSTSGLVKAVIRVNKNLIMHYINKYFDKVMNTVRSKKYDVFLLISGQSLSFSENMIKEIKDCQPQARFVLYQWDSLENFPYIEKIEKYFDKCYSFDKQDVESHSNLIFLPLFYSKQYEKIGSKHQHNYIYDFCFVGTAHPKKYRFINMMAEQLKKVYPNQFIYYFFPSKLVFFYRKIMNKEFRKAHYSEFHFTPLDSDEINKLYTESKCILDSAQSGQSGLTIRVLEALGAKKKLITTNADVVNYDFYRKENIYVYDGEFDLNDPFFTSSYVEIDENIYRKYSLRSWLEEML